MARKKRKSIKEKKALQEKIEISENVIEQLEITEKEKTQEELKEEKSLFDRKVEALVIAINNPEGQKLALKVKIYNNTCHIYQGIFSNVWGRINPNGSHTIYRHALTNMLRKNSATRDLF